MHSFSMEESLFQELFVCRQDMMHDIVTRSPKNKSEKWSIPASGMRGTRCVSHFWPRGLIRQM